MGFIDGSLPCLAEFLLDSNGNLSKEVNPDYLVWIQQDENVLCWITATLSEGILAHVVGFKSSREVWLALEGRFVSLS